MVTKMEFLLQMQLTERQIELVTLAPNPSQ